MSLPIPCPNPCIACPPTFGAPNDPANPFVNLSSEDPDGQTYFGRGYRGGFPPLGQNWLAATCLGFCVSDVSQEEADTCAARDAVACLSDNWPTTNINPGTGLPEDTPLTIYRSNPQSCTFTCPDGTPSVFTTVRGLITSVANQATADAQAYSWACNHANSNYICVSTLLPSSCCLNASYFGTVQSTSPNQPVTWTEGTSLPPGLVLTFDTTRAIISGTPTQAGDYSFQLLAHDSNGNTVSKDVTLVVFGITTDNPLPNGTVGDFYSEILMTAGSAAGPITWSLDSGVMPTGVTLNAATGEISGTPTNDGVFLLTIKATDGVLSCSKNFALTVDVVGFSFDNMIWDLFDIIAGVGVASAVGGQIDWQGQPSPVGCLTTIEGHMDVVLTAPQACNLSIDAVTYGFGVAPAGYGYNILIEEIILGVPTTLLHVRNVADFAAAGIFNFPFVCSAATSTIHVIGSGAGGGPQPQFSYTRNFGALDGFTEINATLTP